MQIIKGGSNPSNKGLAEWFTGTVRVDPLFAAEEPSRVAGAHVTFGRGWVQREGEQRVEIRAGDVVRFAPDERHWHGAGADTAMSHIAIQESLDGSAVTWLEPVSDADYAR